MLELQASSSLDCFRDCEIFFFPPAIRRLFLFAFSTELDFLAVGYA